MCVCAYVCMCMSAPLMNSLKNIKTSSLLTGIRPSFYLHVYV